MTVGDLPFRLADDLMEEIFLGVSPLPIPPYCHEAIFTGLISYEAHTPVACNQK